MNLVWELIKETKSKNKRDKKQTRLPKRAAITNTIFKLILDEPRPKHFNLQGYYRFLLCCTLLYATGIRINEVAKLSKTQILELIDKKATTIFLSKSNKFHTIVIAQTHQHLLSSDMFRYYIDSLLQNENDIILHCKSIKTFNDWFNKKLTFILKRIAARESDDLLTSQIEHLSSHSFRIGRVTRLLKSDIERGKSAMAAENVQVIMGHQSVQTTLAYRRANVLDEALIQELEHIENDE